MLKAVVAGSKNHTYLTKLGYRTHHVDGMITWLEPPNVAESDGVTRPMTPAEVLRNRVNEIMRQNRHVNPDLVAMAVLRALMTAEPGRRIVDLRLDHAARYCIRQSALVGHCRP